jgi:type VI protein secretion system component VasK
VWPDATLSNALRITLSNHDQQLMTLDFNSPWGLFKWLQASHITQKGTPLLWTATTQKDDFSATLELALKYPYNPFALDVLGHFQLPKEIF